MVVETSQDALDVESEPTESTPPSRPGTRFGRHEVCFEIASGGMGRVYLARTEGPGGFEKLVALKCIHPRLATESRFVKMFLDEARIASRIHHPNVCQVFDFGEANSTYYITMEYLVGEPLADVVRAVAGNPTARDSKRWPMFAAKIIADACEGLHAAHELRGNHGEELYVVHRDISPQNLFVTYEGHVSVVDFGIASASGRLQKTQTGQIRGKTAYMAPEQFSGSGLDRRVDIWALGVVLWEMLTLERLFLRENVGDSVIAVVHDPIPRPSSIRSGLPTALDAIVEKALQRQAEKRYATARDFGRDLMLFLRDQRELVGLADLSEWVGQLFPTGRAAKTRLAEAARRGHAFVEGVAPVSEETARDPSLARAAYADPTRPETPREFRGAHGTGNSTTGEPTIVDRVPVTVADTTSSLRQPAQRGAYVRAALAAAVVVSAISVGVYLGVPSSEDSVRPVRERERRTAAAAAAPQARIDTRTVPLAPDASSVSADAAAHVRGQSAPGAGDPRERSPGQARAPLERTVGSVAIAVRGGWATVFHGTRRLGQTPLTVELPVGTQRLRLQHPGGEQWVTVRVRARGTEAVVVRLDGSP